MKRAVENTLRPLSGSARTFSVFAVAVAAAAVLILLLAQPPALSSSQAQNSVQEKAHSSEGSHSVSAQEGEHEASHGGDSGFLAKALNFAVLFGALFFLLRKRIGRMLGQRAEDIRSSIVEAEDSHRTAVGKLSEGQNKLELVAEEVKGIEEEAMEAATKERKTVLASARQEVERLKKLGMEEIALLSQVGMRELKMFAAERATSIARENIKNKITAADQEAMIDRAIDRLDSLSGGKKDR